MAFPFAKVASCAIIATSLTLLASCGYSYNEDNAKLARLHSAGVISSILDTAVRAHFRGNEDVRFYPTADSALQILHAKCTRLDSVKYLGQESLLHPESDPVFEFDYFLHMDCGRLKIHLAYIVTDQGYRLAGFHFGERS